MTDKTVNRTTTPAAVDAGDPLDAIAASAEDYLATKLAAGSPLVALDAPSVLGQFRQIATSLRLAVAQRAAPADLTDDPQAFAASFLQEQLAKEVEHLLANAQTRANLALHTATGQWRGYVDNAQRAKRWAQVQVAQRGTR